MTTPSDPPPSYEEAVRGGPEALPRQARNGIPLRARRSMEDELRPLPHGWVRELDPETRHQFFVDTLASPPRSIWHHPYDDDTYLDSLPLPERDRIRATRSAAQRRRPSVADIVAEETDGDDGEPDYHSSPSSPSSPRREGENQDRGQAGDEEEEEEEEKKPKQDERWLQRRHSLGRRLKDRLTGTTHEQRAAERARRAAAERELYRQHRLVRRAMIDAMRTGRPQPLGVAWGGDASGWWSSSSSSSSPPSSARLYLEPPGRTFPGVVAVHRLSPYLIEVIYDREQRPGPPGRYLRPEGDMYGVGYGGYGCGGHGGGRWDRPQVAYGRPLGTGFGGGLGMPLMIPSLLGGMMLGGLMGSAF
ncbi:uncharacterized protein P884DRAFT_280807 [Thermothelomyces heterothallicus CBS 202.75]|uniref:uncharacterized protein n=1 Tax=Thermothelomyces heterothallicus CBS 202.75 TaxID=1149848 RepID=UPI00374270C0